MKLKIKISGYVSLLFCLLSLYCQSPPDDSSSVEIEPLIDVNIAEAVRGNISKKVVFYGETKAKEASIISSQFSGRLKDFALYKGDTIQIEQRIAVVVGEQAEALLQGAKNITGLEKSEFIKNEIKETYISSPLSGTVVEKYKNNGDVVTKGEPILKILDLSVLYLWGSLPSVYLTEVKTGQKALVYFEDIPGRVFATQIGVFEGEVNPENKTIKVRIDMPNPENVLKSGMFAKIEAITEQKNNTLLVPRSAILTRGDEKYVFTINNGKAKEVSIKTGISTDDQIEIVDGIQEKDTIVVLGNYELEDGIKIRTVGK